MDRPRERPPVTVAVVSWNTRDLLSRCLLSLRDDVEAGRASVWVVDNASSDGSADLARRVAPWATVIEAGENLGFGRAVDLVAQRTDSPWIAPANADIAVDPSALATLLRTGRDKTIGIVAPRLVLPDGRTQHSVHPFPTLGFAIAFNLGLPRLSRRLAEAWCLEDGWDPARARAVPWAVGAFLLVRRDAFSAVGGFDADQWMYAEDLDLGWRMARAGFSTRYEPTAVVRHEESAATTAAFGEEKTMRFMAATYAVIVRRRGAALARLTAAVNCAGAAARLVWAAPLARRDRRWADARDVNRRWLAAHRQGLRPGGLG